GRSPSIHRIASAGYDGRTVSYRSAAAPNERRRSSKVRSNRLGELLAYELTDGAAVGAAGDLRHHVGHHPPHVAHSRGLVLCDRVVDDLLELVLGERRRHELLEDRELALLLLGLLLPAGGAERLGGLEPALALALEHLELLVVGERALEILLR